MKKKSNKNSKPIPKYNSERETRVLLEEMNQSIKTIAEQYSAIVDRLDKIDERLQKHDAVRFKLEWGIETLQNRVGTIDAKLDRIGGELKTVESAVKDVDVRVSTIEKKLDTVTTDHEDRLRKLETVS